MGSNIDKIKALTKIKEYEGKPQIGVLFEGKEGWRNIRESEEVLMDLVNTILRKNNTISYDLNDGVISNITLIEKGSSYEPMPQEQSFEGNWQEDMVNFETLLNDAHNKFKEGFSIRTELLDCDMKEKFAIFKAHIKIDETGQVFQAHGDATQENCQSNMIKPHFLRMAETRSIARCLRWATNNAQSAEEEKQ